MSALTPRAIQIDASSHCQLACPVCPTATGRTRAVLGAGHLKLSDFQLLLDNNPEIAEVELSNYGEMFLNPQLPDILACAHARNVVVSGSNGVNLNFARDEALDAIVRYRVRALTCSIDGASQQTYAKYRVNGNLDRVLGNVDRILALRTKYNSAFPLLDWQFVVFGHNENELPAAREMARKRGMGFVPRLSWSADYSPVADRQLVSIETALGASSRAEFREKKGVDYTREICFQLWHAPVLNWDGKMLGCCVNFWGDFGGNVFQEGLAAGMRHPKIEHARQMLMGRAAAQPGIPCTTCGQYESLAASGDWLDEREAGRHERQQILVGIVPSAPPGIKFAQTSVASGIARHARPDNQGRLFRFGVDTGIYFSVSGPGVYTILLRPLGPSGWQDAVAHVINVAPKPILQEFHADLNRPGFAALHQRPDDGLEWLPSWIR